MNAGGIQQARAALLNDCGGPEPDDEDVQTTVEQKQKVAHLIAGWPNHDAETAGELMLMLGVHPRQVRDYEQRMLTSVPVNRIMA